MRSTTLTVQFFFKRSAQRSLLSPPGWKAVMGLSPTSSLGTILSLAVLVFSRGTSLARPPWPPAFSLVLHPLVERIQREVPGLLLNGWYLDDGTLGGFPEDLLSALAILEEDGPSCGLHLNHSKSLLFLPPNLTDNSWPLPQDIPTISEGFVSLGLQLALLSFAVQLFVKGLRRLEIRSSSFPCWRTFSQNIPFSVPA